MTTIIGYRHARNDWRLHADTRSSGGYYTHNEKSKKLFAWGPWIFGICGLSALVTKLQDEARRDPDAYPRDPYVFAEYWKKLVKKRNASGSSVLMTDGKQCFWIEESGYVREIHERFYTIGSGADYAMGALAMGASPAQAIKVSMKFDLGTGGSITELSPQRRAT